MRMKPKRIRRIFAKSIGASSLHGQIGMITFLVVAFAILSLSWVSKDFSNLIKQTTFSVVAPVLEWVSSPVYAVRDGFDTVTDLSTLRTENADLLAKNEKLEQWYWAAKSLQVENNRYKRLLDVVQNNDNQKHEFITTRVIADLSNEYVKGYIIPAGTNDGVEKGQSVLDGNGLIGRIIDVGSNSSKVMLVTDINAKIPVLIEGSQDIRAIMAGNNDDHPELLYLPDDAVFETGMSIVTSGHGGMFPAGLKVGETIKTEGSDMITVKLIKDPARAYMVHVLKNHR